MSKLDHTLKLISQPQRALAKDEIKSIMLELIGEDDPPKSEWWRYGEELLAPIRYRSKLRKKVETL